MEPIVIHFKAERSTKNTIVFQEIPEKGMPPKVGTLYLQKWAAGEDAPEEIVVTVEASA
jgi:hypothetical protein